MDKILQFSINPFFFLRFTNVITFQLIIIANKALNLKSNKK